MWRAIVSCTAAALTSSEGATAVARSSWLVSRSVVMVPGYREIFRRQPSLAGDLPSLRGERATFERRLQDDCGAGGDVRAPPDLPDQQLEGGGRRDPDEAQEAVLPR